MQMTWTFLNHYWMIHILMMTYPDPVLAQHVQLEYEQEEHVQDKL